MIIKCIYIYYIHTLRLQSNTSTRKNRSQQILEKRSLSLHIRSLILQKAMVFPTWQEKHVFRRRHFPNQYLNSSHMPVVKSHMTNQIRCLITKKKGMNFNPTNVQNLDSFVHIYCTYLSKIIYTISMLINVLSLLL